MQGSIVFLFSDPNVDALCYENDYTTMKLHETQTKAKTMFGEIRKV